MATFRFDTGRATILAFALAVAGGCASTIVQPEEMSAEAHRKEAAKERERAAEQRKQYDPKAQRADHTLDTALPRPDPVVPYNPTEWHLTEAEKASAHARAHERAAAELAAFEDAQCTGFSPATRAACPAMVPVTGVEDIEGGVRLRLAPGADTDSLVAHMRCHLAYARTRGFVEGADCPLYIKGVAIRPSKDGQGIDVIATEAAVIPEIRKRARGVAHIEH